MADEGGMFRFNFDVGDDDDTEAKLIGPEKGKENKEAGETKKIIELTDGGNGVKEEEDDIFGLDECSAYLSLVAFLRFDTKREGTVTLDQMEALFNSKQENCIRKGIQKWIRERRRARWTFSFDGNAQKQAASNSDLIDPRTWLSAFGYAVACVDISKSEARPIPKGRNSPNPLSSSNIYPNTRFKSPIETLQKLFDQLEKSLPPLILIPGLQAENAGLLPVAISHGSPPMVSYALKFVRNLDSVMINLGIDGMESMSAHQISLLEFLWRCDDPWLRAPGARKSEVGEDDEAEEGETSVIAAPHSQRSLCLAEIAKLIDRAREKENKGTFQTIVPELEKSKSPERLCRGWFPLLPTPVEEEEKGDREDKGRGIGGKTSLSKLSFPGEFEKKCWEMTVTSPESLEKLHEGLLKGAPRSEQLCAALWFWDMARHGFCHAADLVRFLDALGPELRPRAIEAIGDAFNGTLAPAGIHNPYCCVCGRVVGVKRCARCQVTSFCGQAHREHAKDFHGGWCEAFRVASTRGSPSAIIKESAKVKLILGRKGSSTSFPASWEAIFRGSTDILEGKREAPSNAQVKATESLSFVLTVALAIKRLFPRKKLAEESRSCTGREPKAQQGGPKSLCVHIVGAGGKEEKAPWQHLSGLVPEGISSLRLILIGAEAVTREKRKVAGASENGVSITVEALRGCYHDKDMKLPRGHLIIAMNSGIHHYGSWSYTLTCILRSPLQLPLVVTAWELTEAVVVRQILFDHGGRLIDGFDLQLNPFSSLLPKETVENHVTACFDNLYLVAVKGTPAKKMVDL